MKKTEVQCGVGRSGDFLLLKAQKKLHIVLKGMEGDLIGAVLLVKKLHLE